jgi:hypothetical protein
MSEKGVDYKDFQVENQGVFVLMGCKTGRFFTRYNKNLDF